MARWRQQVAISLTDAQPIKTRRKPKELQLLGLSYCVHLKHNLFFSYFHYTSKILNVKVPAVFDAFLKAKEQEEKKEQKTGIFQLLLLFCRRNI